MFIQFQPKKIKQTGLLGLHFAVVKPSRTQNHSNIILAKVHYLTLRIVKRAENSEDTPFSACTYANVQYKKFCICHKILKEARYFI